MKKLSLLSAFLLLLCLPAIGQSEGTPKLESHARVETQVSPSAGQPQLKEVENAPASSTKPKSTNDQSPTLLNSDRSKRVSGTKKEKKE